LNTKAPKSDYKSSRNELKSVWIEL